ncbi:MAG TPA: hypothetical protein VFD16_02530 [Candidatus Saccharimonadales bacterium]|nr:hypothetical protein [Candidatus Saccharimonadales bacterium]
MKVQNDLQNKNSLNLFLNQYFNLFTLLLLLIIFAFAYFLIIGPKFQSTTTTIKDNIVGQKRLYTEQEKKLRDLKTVKDVFDDISPVNIKKFNSVLPDNYIKEQLFGELEEIVVKNGYLISSVTIANDDKLDPDNGKGLPAPGAPTDNEKIGKVTVMVAIAAIDYPGLKSLLKTFEANTRLFDIESVNFSQAESSAQLEFVTYYYKPVQ